MDRPQDDGGHCHGGQGIALPEGGQEFADGGADEDEIGRVAEAGSGPEPESCGEAEIVAKTLLGVGVDTRIEFRLADRQGLEDESQH